MSKYNHIKSIPIESIPEEEIKQAIKEFAEDDEAMERLLWACYKNKLETNGCHAGARPYISFDYKPNDKYLDLISATLSTKGSQVLLRPDGGNPFSGPDWYKPDLLLGFDTEYQDEADPKFDMLTEAIETENNNREYEPVIKLLDFLLDKNTDLSIRIKHTEEGEYIFSLERGVPLDRPDILEEYNNLFLPAGFELIENETPRKSWDIRETNKEAFIEKINNSINYILSNYSIKTPETIEETDRWKIKAQIKRKECIEKGREEDFELWLMTERERMDRKREQAKKESNK